MSPGVLWHIGDILSGRRTHFNGVVTPALNEVDKQVWAALDQGILKGLQLPEARDAYKRLVQICLFSSRWLIEKLFYTDPSSPFYQELRRLERTNVKSLYWIFASRYLEVLCRSKFFTSRLSKTVPFDDLFRVVADACGEQSSQIARLRQNLQSLEDQHLLESGYRETAQLLNFREQPDDFISFAVLVRTGLGVFRKNLV